MKNIKKLLIFSTLFLSLSLKASSLLFASNLPYKEGVIEYKIQGNKEGKMKIFFKDYGNKISIYEESRRSTIGLKKEIKSLTIIDGYTKTKIDLKTKNATISNSLRASLLDIFSNLRRDEQKKIISKQSKSIIDLECQNIEIDGVKECLNGSIPLLKKIDIFGYNERIVAARIEKVKVDEKYFKIPNYIDSANGYTSYHQASKIISKMLE